MESLNLYTRLKPILIFVAIIAFAVLVTIGLHQAKPKPEEEQSSRPPLTIRTAEAQYKQQKVSASFRGEVRAKTEIDVVTEVAGKVVKVADEFIEGGEFKSGQMLVQIDDADYLVALKSAQANVASAQVELGRELATAETNAQQWQELQKRPLSEANPLVLNKPQIESARARVGAAEAQLAAAELAYKRTKVSAPFAGRIMSKSSRLGQFMPLGASIGRVFASDAMEIRIPMTDVQMGELGIQMGYSASRSGSNGLPAKVLASLGGNAYEWQGWLRSVDASIDSSTRLVFATIVVDQILATNTLADANTGVTESVLLAPGLFVDVKLDSPKELFGIEVPRTALRRGSQVYVYDQNKLKVRNVDVIYTSQDLVMVDQAVSELEPGELVIVSPVPGAYADMPVELVKQTEVPQAPLEQIEPEQAAQE